MKKQSLAVLFLASAICLSGCSEGNKDNNKDNNKTTAATEKTTEVATSSNQTTPETPTTDFGGIFDKEVNNPTYNASPITFVVNGVKYTTPGDYLMMYSDDIGPIVYMSNVFQMKMIRKESTFDDVLKNLAELDDKAIGNGAKSVKEPETKKIGGKTFAYFVVDMEGEKTMGVLTESPDKKFCIGGQIAIQSDNVSYDDLLNMVNSITSTASLTSDKDSTAADIDAQIKFITGEKRTVSTLKYKKSSVTYKVPAGFYFTSESEGATTGNQFYSSADYDAFISIEEKAFKEDTAEYSIDASVQFEENAVKQVKKVGSRTVYICTSHYKSDNGKTYYNLTGKIDIDDEYTYCVSVDSVDKGDIAYDKISKFFELED